VLREPRHPLPDITSGRRPRIIVALHRNTPRTPIGVYLTRRKGVGAVVSSANSLWSGSWKADLRRGDSAPARSGKWEGGCALIQDMSANRLHYRSVHRMPKPSQVIAERSLPKSGSYS